MKIAYLSSLYPAVSHTFISREVQALRARGVDVQTFSVRRAGESDILGEEAIREAQSTRWLVPPRIDELVLSLIWVAFTRPVRAVHVLWRAIGKRGLNLRERFLWLCYFCEAAVLARWLGRERIDHLHCHFGNSGSSTGMIASRLCDIPFSMTCHGSELLDMRENRLAEKVECASFVACVSKHGKAQLMMNCPSEHWKKLHVIRSGLKFIGPPSENAEKRRGCILCVGRLSREKGHLVLVEALARLRDEGCDYNCVFVGDGPLRGAIETRINELRLGSRVSLAGSLPSAEVLEMYKSAEVVVLASFSEGVPVVLMEAMAAACPVVATRVGGVPELVKNGQTGVLVAPGDVRELSQAIRWVLDNPEQARQLGVNGCAFVRRQFDLEIGVDQLVKLFERSLDVVSAVRSSHLVGEMT